jgi:Domain of unknown function (DUF4872)/Butirosin biosynthesis protein H, N-terminal
MFARTLWGPLLFASLCAACSAASGGGASDEMAGAPASGGEGGSAPAGSGGALALGGANNPGGGGTPSASCTPSTDGKLGVDCATVGIKLVPPYDQSYSCLDLGEDPNIPTKWGGLTTSTDDPRALFLGGSEEVLAGRPTMLSGDAFYLDYRDFKVHFPAHRFVLVGFDDAEEVAWVVDRLVPEAQRCSYAALRLSRNPPDFISTYNLWGKFHGTTQERSLEEACASALARSARRMLGDDRSQTEMIAALGGRRRFRVETGLRGLERLAEELPSWSGRPDGRALARYTAACIEKYGTGGGMFRQLFAQFLREARQLVPERAPPKLAELATASAQHWTALAGELEAFAEGTVPVTRAAAEQANAIIELERRLFEAAALTASSR